MSSSEFPTFKRIEVEINTVSDHLFHIHEFLSSVIDFVDFTWTEIGAVNNVIEEYYNLYDTFKTETINDIEFIKDLIKKGEVKSRYRRPIGEKYFIEQHLKLNGIFREDLKSKLNITNHYSLFLKKSLEEKGFKDSDTIKANKGFINWLKTLLKSLLKYFKVDDRINEILGVLEVFFDTLIIPG